MTTFLDTVVDYEDRIVALIGQAQAPVVDAVAKGVELLEGRVPELTYPASLPTPFQVVDTQAAFAKKLIVANTAVVTAVLETVAPLGGFTKTAKVVKPATKAA